MISLWFERLPPSANHMNKYARGRAYPTPNYRDWMQEVDPAFRDQANGASLNGAYKLIITAVRPDRRKRDIDNYIKPISDAVERAGIIQNDCYCEFVSARWVSSGDGVAVRIEPATVE